MSPHTLEHTRKPGWKPAPDQEMYQSFTVDEDRERTNQHYEQPPVFFQRITGGEWNVYSCNLWDSATNDTESQEAKLDLMARCMDLKPGARILDVGCGWGGPLTYLCKRYGARGVGLTLSPKQKAFAEARIARHGVDARIVESHWHDYQDDEPFDAIYTDEVIVHFNDLGGFFGKSLSLLRPGGRMVNKELHFTNAAHAVINRATLPINEIYGFTGNYRTLAQELAMMDDAGFDVEEVVTIPRWQYAKTLARWQGNMHEHRAEIEEAVGTDYYLKFRRYLKLAAMMVTSPLFTVNVVVGRKPE
ncbi:MAG TPA: class I SAM-dependent methyltransferase [Longimicrobium sp.]